MHAHDRTYLARIGFADPDKGDARHDLACQYLSRPEILARIAEMLVRPVAERWTVGRLWSSGGYKGEVTAGSITVTNIKNEYHLMKGDGKYATTVGFLDLVAGFSAGFHFEGKERRTFDVKKYSMTHRDENFISEEEYNNRHELYDEPYRKACVDYSDAVKSQNDRYSKWYEENRMKWNDGGWPESGEFEEKLARLGGERDRLKAELPVERTVREDRWCEYRDTTKLEGSIVIEVKVGPTSAAEIIRQIGLYRSFFGVPLSSGSPGPIWCVVTAFPITDPDRESFRRAGIVHLRLSPAFDAWCEEHAVARDDPAADVTI